MLCPWLPIQTTPTISRNFWVGSRRRHWADGFRARAFSCGLPGDRKRKAHSKRVLQTTLPMCCLQVIRHQLLNQNNSTQMWITTTNELKSSFETVQKLSSKAILIYENKNPQTAEPCSHHTTSGQTILIRSSSTKCSGLQFDLIYFLSKIGIKIIPPNVLTV